jgi:hypothetical protein
MIIRKLKSLNAAVIHEYNTDKNCISENDSSSIKHFLIPMSKIIKSVTIQYKSYAKLLVMDHMTHLPMRSYAFRTRFLWRGKKEFSSSIILSHKIYKVFFATLIHMIVSAIISVNVPFSCLFFRLTVITFWFLFRFWLCHFQQYEQYITVIWIWKMEYEQLYNWSSGLNLLV